MQNDSSATSHFAPGFRVDHSAYSAICHSPKDKDHADLCQQWRVAEAAETALYLNGLSLLLLLGAFIAAVWAAKAASAAAKAADKTVELSRRMVTEGENATIAAKRQADLAEESFKRLERPWVFVELHRRIFKVQRSYYEAPSIPHVLFGIVNFGRAPAIIDGCSAGIVVAKPTPETPLLDPRWYGPLGPDKKIERCKSFFPDGIELGALVDLREDDEEEAVRAVPKLAPEEALCFIAEIRYRDIRGERYETLVCWRYDTADAHWVQYGGDEYNHQT